MWAPGMQGSLQCSDFTSRMNERLKEGLVWGEPWLWQPAWFEELSLDHQLHVGSKFRRVPRAAVAHVHQPPPQPTCRLPSGHHSAPRRALKSITLAPLGFSASWLLSRLLERRTISIWYGISFWQGFSQFSPKSSSPGTRNKILETPQEKNELPKSRFLFLPHHYKGFVIYSDLAPIAACG